MEYDNNVNTHKHKTRMKQRKINKRVDFVYQWENSAFVLGRFRSSAHGAGEEGEDQRKVQSAKYYTVVTLGECVSEKNLKGQHRTNKI